MTTQAQWLAARDRQTAIYARIEGVGLWLSDDDLTAAGDDARFRFCVETPAHASGEPTTLWRSYLCEPWPDLLSEEAPYVGGGISSYGGVTINLLDHNDALTALFATDVGPVTLLDEDLTAAETAIDVLDASEIDDETVIFVNDEAMRVTAVASNTLTVERGYLGTTAKPHTDLDPVYITNPFLISRKVELLMCPLDSSSAADEGLLGEFFIDRVGWSSDLNVWTISGTSTLKDLERVVPFAPREFVVASFVPPISSGDHLARIVPIFETAVEDFTHWGGVNAGDEFPVIDFYAMSSSGEILGLQVQSSTDSYHVAHRGMFGTEIDEIEIGSTMRQVFVSIDARGTWPSSFRTLDPGDSDPLLDTATPSCHWVDILLGIMTSPHSDEWAPGGNSDPSYRNYSGLPNGYGLGIPASRIDWASFIDVRRRTIQYELPNYVYGEEEKSGVELAQELLEPMGAILSIDNGLIYLSLPRIPVQEDSTTVALGVDEFLAASAETLTDAPQFSAEVSTKEHVGTVVYTVGPEEKTVTFNSVSYAKTFGRRGSYGANAKLEYEVAAADSDHADLYGSKAQSILFRQHRPRGYLSGNVDVSSLWDSPPGYAASITMPEIPDMAGSRGWVGMPTLVKRREHRIDPDDGVITQAEFESFGSRFRCYRVAPAAIITGVSSNTATVAANRYTSSDSSPAQDCLAFEIGDVVRLIDLNGTSAGGTTQIVLSIAAGSNQIELDGDFSGNLATDSIIVASDFDDASDEQQSLFLFAADATNQTIDASSEPARIWGED